MAYQIFENYQREQQVRCALCSDTITGRPGDMRGYKGTQGNKLGGVAGWYANGLAGRMFVLCPSHSNEENIQAQFARLGRVCNTCLFLEGTPGRRMCGQSGEAIYGRAHLTYSCQEWHDRTKPEGAVWPVQAKRVAPTPVLDAQGREITVGDIFPD